MSSPSFINSLHKKLYNTIWFLNSIIPNLLQLDYYQVIINEITENVIMAFEYVVSV